VTLRKRKEAEAEEQARTQLKVGPAVPAASRRLPGARRQILRPEAEAECLFAFTALARPEGGQWVKCQGLGQHNGALGARGA